jgi:2-polyprenyl-6-methoxyphenol hydroxylase-like FAD-dependent oxidoreductase
VAARQPRSVDVAVIGAGPAGAAAAIALAGQGLDVTVFERAAFPRHRPGETLHPGVEAMLEALGVWPAARDAGFLRHRGHWVAWNSPPRFQAYGADAGGPWHGLQAWRADFDRLLLERARAVGAAVEQPVEVVRPWLAGDRVAGLETTEGRRAARWVVDASGADGLLRRALGLHVARPGPASIVRYGYAAGELAALMGGDGAPRLRGARDGWTWMAQARPGVIHWCRGAVGGARVPPGPPAELAACLAAGRSGGADTTCRIVVEAAGRGFFLAGDAAAVLDPIASHGVLRALMGGWQLGRLIGAVARGETDEREAGRRHVGWLQGGFAYECGIVRALYERLNADTPSPMGERVPSDHGSDR